MPAIVGIISVDFEVSSHDRVENLAWKMAHEGNEGRGYFYRHLEGEATKNRYSCRHFILKLEWAQNEKIILGTTLILTSGKLFTPKL